MASIHQEPRLAGRTEPHYNVGAKDAFIQVLVDAAAVRNPSRLSVSYVEPAAQLKDSVDTARMWCNEELGRLLNAFCEVVIEESMGGASEADWERARKDFTRGCRIALGKERPTKKEEV